VEIGICCCWTSGMRMGLTLSSASCLGSVRGWQNNGRSQHRAMGDAPCRLAGAAPRSRKLPSPTVSSHGMEATAFMTG